MRGRLLVITLAAAVLLIDTSQVREVSAKPLETCRVTARSANFFVSATEKTIKLKRGTLLSWTINELHQGLIVVKAKIGKTWVRGEILLAKTSCM
jgi:hypothetical protein